VPLAVLRSGLRLGYDSFGEGFPVLLIAGLGRDRGMWAAQIPALAARHRVIAFDNRGVGESDLPKGPYSTAQLADDAAQLLELLGVDRAHIIGASLGGMIAQEFERRHADRTATLSLLCTSPGLPLAVPMSPAVYESIKPDPESDPLERLTGAMRLAFSRSYWDRNAGRLRDAAARRLETPVTPESWWAQAAAGAGFSSRGRPPFCPCLVMSGEEDLIVPPVNSERLAARIPDARLKLFPDGGHYFFVEQPEAVNGALLEFLAPFTPGAFSAGRVGRSESGKT